METFFYFISKIDHSLLILSVYFIMDPGILKNRIACNSTDIDLFTTLLIYERHYPWHHEAKENLLNLDQFDHGSITEVLEPIYLSDAAQSAAMNIPGRPGIFNVSMIKCGTSCFKDTTIIAKIQHPKARVHYNEKYDMQYFIK